MNIYRIKHSINYKQIGVFPQVETGIYPIMHGNPNFIGNNYFKYLQVVPDVTFPILRKKAKKTDLISASIMGLSLCLTISNKLKNILDKYQKDSVQFFGTKLIDKEIEDTGYFVLYPYRIDYDFIDYPKCSIEKQNVIGPEKEPIKIIDAADFIKKRTHPGEPGKIWGYHINKLALIDNIQSNFFVLDGVPSGIGYYVSEKLKGEIEDVGCTGIEFEPIEQG